MMKFTVLLLMVLLVISITEGKPAAKMKNVKHKPKQNPICKRNDIKNLATDIAGIQAGLKNCCSNNDAHKCEAFPRDCSDDSDFTGVKTIQTGEGRKLEVYCDGGWLYLSRRFDGSVDFYRTWAEYQLGFGDLDGEHFLGLENLVSILRQGRYKLRIDLTMWPPTNQQAYAEYSVFNVADQCDNYRLGIGGYKGTAGDSMPHHNGRQFSTKDRDNDDYGSNCATIFSGAWWYGLCHDSNLYGRYAKGPTCPKVSTCMSWQNWPSKIGTSHNDEYSFKKADLKIYPL